MSHKARINPSTHSPDFGNPYEIVYGHDNIFLRFEIIIPFLSTISIFLSTISYISFSTPSVKWKVPKTDSASGHIACNSCASRLALRHDANASVNCTFCASYHTRHTKLIWTYAQLPQPWPLPTAVTWVWRRRTRRIHFWLTAKLKAFDFREWRRTRIRLYRKLGFNGLMLFGEMNCGTQSWVSL